MRFPVVPAAALLACAAGAQSVLTVDDDFQAGADFPCIGFAAQAAADGDTLLVKDGFYPITALPIVRLDGKSLVVQAEVGAAVRVTSLVVSNLAAGQTLVLRGLEIGTVQLGVDVFGQPDCGGTIVFEDCVLGAHPGLSGIGPPHALTVEGCTSVSLVRTVIDPGTSLNHFGRAGIEARQSSLFLYDCAVGGGDGQGAGPFTQPVAGGFAARLDGGFLYASGTTFAGGQGGAGGLAQGACADGGAGGDGLVLGGGAVVRALGSSFTAGPGGPLLSCVGQASPGPDGQATVLAPGTVLDLLPGTPRSFTSTALVREGQSSVDVFAGQPSELVLQFFAFAPEPGLFLPPFQSASLIGGGVFFLDFGPLPPTGIKTVALPVGDLGPGVETVTVYKQPAFVDFALPAVTLGPVSAVSLLDAAF